MGRNQNSNGVKYYLDAEGRFIIEGYQKAEPFTNFFPGVAGLWGIPMWAFYVNRGQCISSLGIEGKDKAIMEFQPANKAYRLTSLQGFRTFIKIKQGKKVFFYEPFQNHPLTSHFKTKQRMAITSHDLTIEENNLTLGLVVRVNYFTLPEEPYAALVREVTIKNTGKKTRSIELIDGMPLILPYGLSDRLQKDISRTIEAWKRVCNLKQKAPYYNMKVVISDTPAVESILEGNFYFSFTGKGKKKKLLNPIVDISCIFGHASDFIVPEAFYQKKGFKISAKQETSNRSLCAMSYCRFSLPRRSEKKITSLIGHAHSIEVLRKIVKKVRTKDFIAKKAKLNEKIIKGVKNFALTSSDSQAFNLYCGQTFLDNVLRGGLPVSFNTSKGKFVFNVFNRKHGDPERDYNAFVLSPTYLSQGNGNYRDVNQNRRNDVWFNSDVKEGNIVNFMSLIQADGYNPLVIKGLVFYIDSPKKIEGLIQEFVGGKQEHKNIISTMLEKGFQPGQLLKVVERKDVILKTYPRKFLEQVFNHCHKHELAEHGEGFWVDHWTYNLDLIERFLAIYPEEKRSLLLEKKTFNFYHNTFHILPRDQRYILTKNGPRQYNSVANIEKEIVADVFDYKLRTRNGKGPVYYTTLIVKLLCLITNKAATFDPSGIGIEMEADKPGWYDALNGLPGLLGSSTSETFELKRLCLFLKESLKEVVKEEHKEIPIYEELITFISGLNDLLATQRDSVSYWRQSNDIKEHYRRRVQHGIDGKERSMHISAINRFLQLVIDKTDKAIALAKAKNGLYTTYLTHDIKEYERLGTCNQAGLLYVRPISFKKRVLPLFLEGMVHALKVEKDLPGVRRLYRNIKKSPLFDKKLKMYRVNDDLSKETPEIGRASVFPAGWLENQSIWSHMEYKFILELLRRGLYKEFYENFRNVLIPFLDAKQYKRSILENSSFIVSSVHEDPKLHGRGFVARLSGTTSEWIHIWLTMNAGENPFHLNKNSETLLTFKPVLAGWLFTKRESTIEFLDNGNNIKEVNLPKNTYAFNFLGSTLVVYHNPKRHNTYGKNKAVISKISISYSDKKDPVIISSSCIPPKHSNAIRENKADRIDIYLK